MSAEYPADPGGIPRGLCGAGLNMGSPRISWTITPGKTLLHNGASMILSKVTPNRLDICRNTLAGAWTVERGGGAWERGVKKLRTINTIEKQLKDSLWSSMPRGHSIDLIFELRKLVQMLGFIHIGLLGSFCNTAHFFSNNNVLSDRLKILRHCISPSRRTIPNK